MGEVAERIVFSGTIDDRGTCKPDRPNETRGRLARWHGRRVTVTVQRYVSPKTNPQLGRYFREGGTLDCWAEYCGYDRDEMHKELKLAYLVPVLCVSRLTGEEIKTVPSLADLNSEEMSAFIERVEREGRQMGIVFPND